VVTASYPTFCRGSVNGKIHIPARVQSQMYRFRRGRSAFMIRQRRAHCASNGWKRTRASTSGRSLSTAGRAATRLRPTSSIRYASDCTATTLHTYKHTCAHAHAQTHAQRPHCAEEGVMDKTEFACPQKRCTRINTHSKLPQARHLCAASVSRRLLLAPEGLASLDVQVRDVVLLSVDASAGSFYAEVACAARINNPRLPPLTQPTRSHTRIHAYTYAYTYARSRTHTHFSH